MAVFTWRAEVGSAGQSDLAVFSSKFGDGYSQDIPNGINNETQQWTVKVTGKGPVVRQVLAFLKAQRGTPFQWKAPNTTGLSWYSCKRWEQSDEGGDHWTLSMTFVQAYMP